MTQAHQILWLSGNGSGVPLVTHAFEGDCFPASPRTDFPSATLLRVDRQVARKRESFSPEKRRPNGENGARNEDDEDSEDEELLED